MPFEIRRVGDKWCVFNKNTGRNTGCSDSRSMAEAHMRALFAHSKDTVNVAGAIKK